MAIKIQLTRDEARFLHDRLRTDLANIETEIVHSSSREEQRHLAEEAMQLRTIALRVDRVLSALEVEELMFREVDGA
jgi:hypothetical protein